MSEESEIAILMAAGLGTRMKPISDTTPKPLVKIHGKPMIETIIEGLKKRGVSTFYVVTGYLEKNFEYLTEKYDGINLIHNKEFETINNISSIKAVSDVLKNTDSNVFICEADLFVRDNSVFLDKHEQSCYYGKMVYGHSDDWVFELDEEGRITRIGKAGDDCYNMVGISYFFTNDARRLGKMIDDAYEKKGYENLFWDDVVNQNLDKMELIVHKIKNGMIDEIDTVDELVRVDDSYSIFL